jgi:hypothetical protein
MVEDEFFKGIADQSHPSLDEAADRPAGTATRRVRSLRSDGRVERRAPRGSTRGTASERQGRCAGPEQDLSPHSQVGTNDATFNEVSREIGDELSGDVGSDHENHSRQKTRRLLEGSVADERRDKADQRNDAGRQVAKRSRGQ